MNSSSQDTVLFHCCLAQSAISLLCSLFAAQVHHLTYVGIFKQFFFPRRSLFHLWNHGASCWLHRTPHTLPSFFSVCCLSVPTPTHPFSLRQGLSHCFSFASQTGFRKYHPLTIPPPLAVCIPNLFIFCKISVELNFQFLLPFFYCFSIFCPFMSCNFPCS